MLGRLSDRLGYKTSLVASTLLAGLMCFPHAAAQTVWQLVLLRIAFGLGIGGMIPAMNAMVATTVSRASVGRAYGFTVTASALGWATGPALGGWAASALGYRLPFVIAGGLLVLVSMGQQRWLTSKRSASA